MAQALEFLGLPTTRHNQDVLAARVPSDADPLEWTRDHMETVQKTFAHDRAPPLPLKVVQGLERRRKRQVKERLPKLREAEKRCQQLLHELVPSLGRGSGRSTAGKRGGAKNPTKYRFQGPYDRSSSPGFILSATHERWAHAARLEALLAARKFDEGPGETETAKAVS